MKTFLSKYLGLFVAVWLLTCYAQAQETPKYDMGKMQMVFLNPDPDWKPAKHSRTKQVKQEHDRYVADLIKTGKCAMAGPVKGSGNLREILVFKIESVEEVQELTNSFPGVKSGMYKAEVLPWYAARNVIKTPAMPLANSNYIFGLLVRGDKWTPGETPEAAKIQEGHMANINRLAEAGKLVLAGPFYGDGARRGVFIFKVATLDEAQELTDTDPAVIARRLRIELYQWSVPTGILP